MTISGNKRIPDTSVYIALYAAIFSIGIWLMVFHAESPNNWILYIAMIGSVVAGLAKVALRSAKGLQRVR